MKVKDLESISEKTCVWKVNAMMQPVVTEALVKCRYRCNLEYQKECPSYRPVEYCQLRSYDKPNKERITV